MHFPAGVGGRYSSTITNGYHLAFAISVQEPKALLFVNRFVDEDEASWFT
ncbi:MAG: hypothetical protein ACL7BU_06445 [Candidatus Phlomobacter fragariae]